jgi:hypothetical protein
MRTARWRGAWLGLVVALSRCEVPATQLIVGIDSDLSWGPGREVEAVTLEVRRGGANGLLRSRRTTALGTGSARESLALWVTVVASDPADATPIWIEALGCAGASGCTRETAVVAQRASVSLVPRSTGTLRMLLARSCVPSRCTASERCEVSNGRCVPAASQGEVRLYDGSLPRRFAAGAPGLDAGVPRDGAADTGLDAPPDTGPPMGLDAVALDVASDASLDSGASSADAAAVDSSDDADASGNAVTDVSLDLGGEGAVDSGSAPAPPRPIAPISLGDVTQRRPTLRWEQPVGYSGAEVQLCRDRTCTNVIEMLTVSAASARPSADLPARSVVFWRVRAREPGRPDTAYGPTWLFHVPARGASTSVDTSYNPHFDVNGDGYDDVVVGAAQASRGSSYVGVVSVYLGSSAGTLSTPQRTIVGPWDRGWFGSSVACAGDTNGDGYADLVVGAHAANPGGRPSAGTASIFLGGAAGISETAQRVLGGPSEGDTFGFSVAGAGDVNADGFADVIIGAHGADPGGRANAGTASVFLGNGSGVSATPHRILEGAASGDEFGESVASVGDVNGDGYSDLGVGAVNADPTGRLGAGTTSLFVGSASGTVATAIRVLNGTSSGEKFGDSIANAGDVNGDGYSDLIVGAPGASPRGRTRAGSASVYLGTPSGIAPSPQSLLEGVSAGDYFGDAVATAGDVNADGYSDVIVGDFRRDPAGRMNAGTASIFLGSSAGIVVTALRALEGVREFDHFGISVARAGDVNGDGYDDVIVGAEGADSGDRIDAGSASVFLGGASGTAATPDRTLAGAARNDSFGFSVAHFFGLRTRFCHPPINRWLFGLS